MFRNWGFLMTEMIGLIILAALLGLLVGWLIWARRSTHETDVDRSRETALQADLDRCRTTGAKLQSDLDACTALHSDKDARIATLEADLDAARRASATPTAIPAAMPVAAPVTAPAANMDRDYDGDGVIEGANEGQRPEALTAARGGVADDLKLIKGIGPKLERLCNSLGFYHFDQVANWTADEVAWVDANLEGFKGRVSRDEWVPQAKILAAGGTTEFAERQKD